MLCTNQEVDQMFYLTMIWGYLSQIVV